MNRVYATVCSVLVVLVFNQQSFCMKKQSQQLVVLDGFSHLELPIQKEIMRYSDNQANIQLTNKPWSQQVSIKNQETLNYFLTNPERVTQILLHAAYKKNYEGVENILKNSCLLKNNCPHLFIDIHNNIPLVLDLHTIAGWGQDQYMIDLLTKYKVVAFDQIQTVIPTPLLMNCLEGNSSAIISTANENNYWKSPVDGLTGIQYVLINKENALKIAIDCDHGKCITTLLEDMLVDSDWVSIEENRVNCKTLLTEDLLWRAINKLKLQALEALLVTGYFDINTFSSITIADEDIQCTLLDKIKLKVTTDPDYKPVVSLLKKYGAKTLKEIEKEKAEEKDMVIRLMSCVIS